MKKLLFLLLLAALPLQAQTGIGMHRQGYAQALSYSNWQHNIAGDTLVAVVRIVQKLPPPPCEPNCGNMLIMVTDFNGNQWRPACIYNVNVCAFWYALNAKPGWNAVGVVASRGDFGGNFYYDVIIAEYPPAIALDAYSEDHYYNGGGDDEPHAGAVTTTAPHDLLVFWTNNLSFTPAHPPITLTPELGFKVENDDGFLAMADSPAGMPGSYMGRGLYNGYCQWRAGVAAFKMATPSKAVSPNHGSGTESSAPPPAVPSGAAVPEAESKPASSLSPRAR